VYSQSYSGILSVATVYVLVGELHNANITVQDLWRQKTRDREPSCSVVCTMIDLVVLLELRLVTDRRTERRRAIYRARSCDVAYQVVKQTDPRVWGSCIADSGQQRIDVRFAKARVTTTAVAIAERVATLQTSQMASSSSSLHNWHIGIVTTDSDGEAESLSSTMWPGLRPTPYQVASWSIQPFDHSTPTSQTDRTETDNGPIG